MAADIVDVEIESEESFGEGGFLVLRRVRMRNRRGDGSVSEPYICDFVVRPRGPDAVVVVVYSRSESGINVLLRRGLRPGLWVDRANLEVPIADSSRYLFFTEVVAGILEPEDRGEEGVRRRAAIEVAEEAGFSVSPADVDFLGAGTFPTAGAMLEKFWLTAVEVDPSTQGALEGDGSPMEEGASTYWTGLPAALAACVAGEIVDAKTELALRRLADRQSRVQHND